VLLANQCLFVWFNEIALWVYATKYLQTACKLANKSRGMLCYQVTGVVILVVAPLVMNAALYFYFAREDDFLVYIAAGLLILLAVFRFVTLGNLSAALFRIKNVLKDQFTEQPHFSRIVVQIFALLLIALASIPLTYRLIASWRNATPDVG